MTVDDAGRGRPRQRIERYDPDASGTVPERAFARFVESLSQVAERLPEAPLHRVAATAGAGLSLVSGRRELVRANLHRVSRWLVANGLASPRVARAAEDDRALDSLVRLAFQHYARYYLEVALAPAYPRRRAGERVALDDPAIVAEAFAPRPEPPRGRIFLGMHLGAIELPGAFIIARTRRPVLAPMEVISNAPLQRYFQRSRSGSGIRILSHRVGSRPFLDALARDETVAMIADRDVNQTGHPVTFFGATALLSAGPAVVALESGAPVYAAAIRRVGATGYRARVIPLETPREGRFRERVRVFLERQAAAYERLVADAPEQWWSVFFPIWLDEDGAMARAYAAERRGRG